MFFPKISENSNSTQNSQIHSDQNVICQVLYKCMLGKRNTSLQMPDTIQKGRVLDSEHDLSTNSFTKGT